MEAPSGTTQRQAAPVPGRSTFADDVRGSRAYEAIESAGEMGALAVETLRYIARPPFPWFRESLVWLSLVVRRSAFPVALTMAVFTLTFGLVLEQQLVNILGAGDRQAGAWWISAVREVTVWTGGMVYVGMTASALTADLGARRVREELDALSVLGIQRQRYVAPRVVAAVVGAGAMGMLALAVSMIAYAAFSTVPLGIWWANFTSSVFAIDVVVVVIKWVVIGFVLGIVACYKGIASKGGAEGVGRAVNQAVVITFFELWLVNSFLNLAVGALFPSTQVLRG
jgi:phospholipid/cholesterol/gamma-HCH transport system permease protein